MSKRKSVLIRNYCGMRLLVRDGYIPKNSEEVITRETVLDLFKTGSLLKDVLKRGGRLYETYGYSYDQLCVRTSPCEFVILGVDIVHPVVEEDPSYWRGLFFTCIDSEAGEDEDDEALRDLRTCNRQEYTEESDAAFQAGQEHMTLYIERWA